MTHPQNSFYFKLLFWFSMYLHCIISEWPSKKGWLADGNQLPQAAESILRAGSLWASHSGKSLAAQAGKAGERIRRVEVKTNQNKISMILALIIVWLSCRVLIIFQ